MASTTYKIVKGDTLSAIAKRYGTTVSKLMELNPDISNANLIYAGETIVVSGTAASKSKNTSNKIKVNRFGLQSNTERTIFATWVWDKKNTESYKIWWYYYTGDGVAFVGQESNVNIKQSTYTIPDNATSVAFKVKPIAKKVKDKNGKESTPWTAEYSTIKRFYVKDLPPGTPGTPSVSVDKYKLTAELDNIPTELKAKQIQFKVFKNDRTSIGTVTATIKTGHASAAFNIQAGNEYKVRCRAIRDKLASDWSDYSDNVSTIPNAPKQIYTLKALSSTSIYILWTKCTSAKSYTVEYTTQKRFFDSGTSEVQSTTVDSTVKHAEITGLETGQEYFFRVKATNDTGDSGWSPIRSIKIGKKPSPPTTWSSTSTVIVGDPLNLYWVHNSEDGSSQTYANLVINDGENHGYTIENSTEEDEKDKTSVYPVDTSKYTAGTTLKWQVRTKGVLDEYGDWSIQRIINVYAPPVLELQVTNKAGTKLETLTSFPFYISGTPGPDTQNPIGYHVSIVSEEKYKTVDQIGNDMWVNVGDEVYSRYYNSSDDLALEITPGSVNLDNNVSYKVICTVSMDSGLTAIAEAPFDVAWEDEELSPNAKIEYNPNDLSLTVTPYCEDENGDAIPGVTLSVYRREFDGSFVELATGLVNTSYTHVPDPHPSLDYARYRVVAISDDTGAVSYYDLPGRLIGEKSAVIQWDEQWTAFNTTEEDPMEQPPWTASLLKLPYNIDVSDTYSRDVETVEYIGRKQPVSYYGTQLGHTSSWSMEVPKSDIDTIYALRRLSIYMGDVYVREPSGSGYWATVSVSMDINHCELTVPVTLDITRVAGGM